MDWIKAFVDSLNRLTWPAALVLVVLIVGVVVLVSRWLRAVGG